MITYVYRFRIIMHDEEDEIDRLVHAEDEFNAPSGDAMAKKLFADLANAYSKQITDEKFVERMRL